MESTATIERPKTAHTVHSERNRKPVGSPQPVEKTPESELMTVEEYFDEVLQRIHNSQEEQKMESTATVNRSATMHVSHLDRNRHIERHPIMEKTSESELMEVDEYFDILHKMVDEYYDSIQG